jgi:hypothetical protein
MAVAIVALLGEACAPAEGGGSGGNTTGSGGNNGTGGASPGSGGIGAGTGGAPGSGGANGSGGAARSGGATGSGGASGTGGRGSGGSSGSGGATGSGGRAAGTGGGTGTCPTANEDKFSFFLISNAELIRQGGPDSTGMFSAYGGNLGGIEGADRICQTAAEHVSACQSSKVWHAFLSTPTVNAIDRIGTGPWHDRNGRLWSANLTNLVGDRPTDADPAIKNDIPNENGVRNQNPDGTGNVDNHEIATGTGSNGRAYTQTGTGTGMGGQTSCGPDVGGSGNTWSVERATCWGWTRNTNEGCPRMGRSWCMSSTCTPAGSGSGTNWMSAWNAVGCAPGGTLAQTGPAPSGSRKIGAAGGYGGFYCFAVTPRP